MDLGNLPARQTSAWFVSENGLKARLHPGNHANLGTGPCHLQLLKGDTSSEASLSIISKFSLAMSKGLCPLSKSTCSLKSARKTRISNGAELFGGQSVIKARDLRANCSCCKEQVLRVAQDLLQKRSIAPRLDMGRAVGEKHREAGLIFRGSAVLQGSSGPFNGAPKKPNEHCVY